VSLNARAVPRACLAPASSVFHRCGCRTFQNPALELVNLDSCELIHSHFGLLGNYSAAVALDYLAEISEQLLPPAESNERYFRLLLAVLDHMRSGDPTFLFEGTSTFRVVRRLSRVVLEGPVLRQGVTHSSGGVLLYPSRLPAAHLAKTGAESLLRDDYASLGGP